MIRINVHQAKAHLSRYLAAAEQGEKVVICRRNVPVAELRVVASAPTQKRPWGGEPFEISKDFNAPLPEAMLDAFEGK